MERQMQDILLIPGFMCTSALRDDMRRAIEQLGRIYHAEDKAGRMMILPRQTIQELLRHCDEPTRANSGRSSFM